MSYATPGETSNPFTRNLSDSVGRSVDVRHLSVRQMLWGRFDLFHVHWPENIFRASGRVRNAVKTVCGVVLMLRIELLRIPVVYSQHNLKPHEKPGRLYGALYGWVQRRVRANIYLNESSENDPPAGVTILHGDYPRPAAPRASRPMAAEKSTVLFFGLLRRYKGLETLFDAFAGTNDPRLRLRVRGSASDQAYVNELQSLAEVDPRITFEPGFLDDDELERELEEAALVVLPYVAVYNSGAAILALSRARRILAPAGPSTLSLQNEVGGDFVRLFDSPLNAHDIARAMDEQPRGTTSAVLPRRDWSTIGALHVRLYMLTVANRTLPANASAAAVRHGVAVDPLFVRHSIRNTLVVGFDDGGL